MRLSVVVPTLDEEATLPTALASIPSGAEVIVSDGGSRDRTASLALESGARVLIGEPGRGVQMNRGAQVSIGDTLLFLHADCSLEPDAEAAIRSSLDNPDIVGGSFRLAVNSRRRSLRVIAWGSNLRARYLGLPYGDQAIFVRRSIFERVGGYPEIALLEDVELVRRLRRHGRMARLESRVITGDRHWNRLGPLYTTLLNWVTISLYFAGVPPDRMAPIYRRLRRPSPTTPPPLAVPHDF